MKMLYRWPIIVVLLLGACQPSKTIDDSQLHPSPIATRPMLVTTEPEPSETPTQKNPITSKTNTPSGNINNQDVFDLPEWVKNAKNDLMLFGYGAYYRESDRFELMNPKDGNIFIGKLSKIYYYHYWKDANHILFLHEGSVCETPPKFVTELDIAQGVVKVYDAKDYPDAIRTCNVSDGEKEIVRLNADLPESTIEILDPSSNQWRSLTAPVDGISDISYDVSPSKDYVAVIQAIGKFEFPQLWLPLFGSQISLYRAGDRKLLGTFDTGRKIPTGTLFLDDNRLIYLRENTPCLITISPLSRKCLHIISDKFPNSTIDLGNRLSDLQKFDFIYFGDEPHHGGFCFYNLLSGDLDCPTDQFEILKDKTILNYSLSPNEEYLIFQYDYKGCPPPWCDYAGDVHTAVIDIQNNHFSEIENDSNTWNYDGWDAMWRY